MRITTGKVGTPPKPRTRESPFRAAPAASPANRKIEATRAHTRHYVNVQGEVTSCDGSTGMGHTAARSAWRKAQGSGAGATHLHGVDDDREEEEAPAGPSARPGLEPEAHHQLPASVALAGVAGSTCCPDASADHRGRLSGEARGAPRLRGERGWRQRRQQKELLLWQQRRVRLALAAQLPTSQV